MAIGSEARSTFLAIVKGDASQAITEFKKLEGTVTKSTHGATTGVGKFKSMTQGLAAEIKGFAASPAAMGSAIAAGGAFALQAADKFSQLGVEIGKFSDATGLAAEDASRYIEVAGDIGISTETLTGVFNKLNKSIDPKTFDQLGISIARTSDGNVNVSETFLNVIDQLNKIQDPAKRAEVASKLLGKGWTEVAELVGMSAADIRKQLQAVGDEKVFDNAEIKQARDYRAAMDNLNDAFQKIALMVGKNVAPRLVQMADLLAKIADFAGPMSELGDSLNVGMGSFGDALNIITETTSGDNSWWVDALNSTDQLLTNLPLVGDELGGLIPHVTEASNYSGVLSDEMMTLGDGAAQSARYLGLLAEHTRESADASYDLAAANKLAKAQLQLLQDQIDGRKSFISLAQQLNDNAKKIKDLEESYRQGQISGEEYYLGVADAALESQGAVADYVAEVDSIPQDKKLELVATLDPANPAAIFQEIQNLADSHAIQLTFETDRESRRLLASLKPGDVGYQRDANGGRSSGGLTLVGEYGPEMVNLPAGASVSTAAQTRQMLSGGSGITVVVNAPVGANLVEAGRQIADALNDYYRNGGQRVA